MAPWLASPPARTPSPATRLPLRRPCACVKTGRRALVLTLKSVRPKRRESVSASHCCGSSQCSSHMNSFVGLHGDSIGTATRDRRAITRPPRRRGGHGGGNEMKDRRQRHEHRLRSPAARGRDNRADGAGHHVASRLSSSGAGSASPRASPSVGQYSGRPKRSPRRPRAYAGGLPSLLNIQSTCAEPRRVCEHSLAAYSYILVHA